MGELRRIHAEAVSRAMAKAERYRLLNEPREAESICRDILEVEPRNETARWTLLLALTDQFDGRDEALRLEAEEIAAGLDGEFDRLYYRGVVVERWGKARLEAGFTRATVLSLLREAMDLFDRAESCAPDGNDDGILRWNTCVRMIARYGLEREVDPGRAARVHAEVETWHDDVPPR